MNIGKTTHRQKAFNLFELLLVIAIIVVLAAVFLPAIVTPNDGSQFARRINCINNLKQDTLAFKMWANDNGGKYPMQISVTATNAGAMEFAEKGIAFPIFQVMSNELNTPKILHCPADTKTSAAMSFSNFGNSNISYFVGLDTTEENPQSILLGDDNLTVNGKPVSSGILNLTSNSIVKWTGDRHGGGGNLAFTDGSAQMATISGLKTAVENSISVITGDTNRLVIP